MRHPALERLERRYAACLAAVAEGGEGLAEDVWFRAGGGTRGEACARIAQRLASAQAHQNPAPQARCMAASTAGSSSAAPVRRRTPYQAAAASSTSA